MLEVDKWLGLFHVLGSYYFFPQASVVVICYLCKLSLCVWILMKSWTPSCMSRSWITRNRYSRQLSGNTTKCAFFFYTMCALFPSASRGVPSCTAFIIKIEKNSTFRYADCVFFPKKVTSLMALLTVPKKRTSFPDSTAVHSGDIFFFFAHFKCIKHTFSRLLLKCRTEQTKMKWCHTQECVSASLQQVFSYSLFKYPKCFNAC